MGYSKIFRRERAPALIAILCGEVGGPLQLVDGILEPRNGFGPIINLRGVLDGPADENRDDAILVVDDGDGCSVWS